MEIEITKTIKKVEVIEVELPYYYKYDLMSEYGDSIIYGKIEEKLCTSIHETKDYDNEEEEYKIEKNHHSSIKNSGLASYFDKQHKSSKEEFYAAKERCTSFLNGC